MLKPDIGEETMSITRRTFRGGWGQRAGKEQSRKPGRSGEVGDQRPEGIHNGGNGLGRKSERLIVARKRVTTVERRGFSESMLL
jgi:hypothetical protein